MLIAEEMCSDVVGTTCNVEPASDRINCGYGGITARECQKKRCCYNDSVSGVPWCFHPVPLTTTAAATTEKLTTTETPGPNCNVKNRVNCGYGGIQPHDCRAKGCCWDARVPGVPWCFSGVETTTPYITTKEPPPNCNVADPSDRVDCGYDGIHPDSCHERNCCWNSSIEGVPWCFFGKEVTTQAPDNCDVGEPSARVDCGHPGIHPDTCRQRNCCWDESIRDVAWCFYGKDRTTRAPPLNCDVGEPSDRVDCGHPGIHPDTCRQRNCCWDESIRDVPWCFNGVSSTAAATTAVLTTVTQAPTPQCNIPRKQRKRCGQHGISRAMCLYEGCCWEMMYGAPSCYYSSAPSCDVQPTDRLSCGYIGITETRCSDQGCCWDNSVYGRLKCYRPHKGQSSQLVRQ